MQNDLSPSNYDLETNDAIPFLINVVSALKKLSFTFYLLNLQLVLRRVTALKVSPYITHSADYRFFGPLRSAVIF